VFDALRDLEAEGYVRREERTRDNGSRTSSVYVLAVSGQPDTPVRDLDGPPSGQPDPQNPKEEPVGKKESDDSQESGPDPVDAVWAAYVEEMAPRRSDLDPESRRIIRDALKLADVEECKRAIVGCRASAFHMGENDRRKSYNALSQILKGKRGGRTTREQVDFFIEIADKSGAARAGVPSADPFKVQRAKADVIAAWEFPNDDRVAESARTAREWLARHGWLVEFRQSDGHPTFRRAA
jgi:hypothetical protein